MPYLIVTSIPSKNSEQRDRSRAEHIAYLEASASVVLAAGAKLHDDGTMGDGSFYLIDVETRREAQAFIEGDPYFARGLIEDLTLTRVRKGFFNRSRQPA